MLACRFHRVVRFTSRCVESNCGRYFQGRCSFNSLRCGVKDKPSAMGRSKKQKTINQVWRPVSNQAEFVEECMVKNGKEGQCTTYGDVSTAESVIEDAKEVNEVSDVSISISSSTLRENDEHGMLETVSSVSTEKHSISLEVGASVIRFIRGKEGSTQKRIEEEMGVKVILPSSKKEDCITVEGTSVDSVTRASEKIQAIIGEAVKSPSLDYSHFISLPLAIHPELVDKLVHFQNSILGNVVDDDSDDDPTDNSSENEDKEQQSDKRSDVTVELKVNNNSDRVEVDIKSIPLVSYQPKAKRTPTLFDLGIEKSIFIKPKTFHLTVLMLKLWNKDRVNAAREVLESISANVMDALDNRPLFVRLKGLDCMKGSLAKARVLYVPVEEVGNEGRLLYACQVVIDAFVKAGLVLEKDAKQSLKLHATVMNARHRKRNKRSRKVDSFDARGIYKQFGSEEWGEYLIREAHLSQRFVFDESGYYHCCTSIPFPGNTQVENMQVD